MKVPKIFQSLFGKEKEHRETFLSLYLDAHSLAASFWSAGGGISPENLGWAHVSNIENTWTARGDAADRTIGELEQQTGITDVTNVILGLPLAFLSPTGEIRKEVRVEIKELMKLLDLTPVGFVPIYQAIIYKLKHDEGVPPSVILLGINDKTIAVSLYKIGALAGIREIEKTKDLSGGVEESLKSFTDQEVLPARMLLYGSPQAALEEAKSELLRHSWTTAVNFLHFPKIDVISELFIVDAISLAGSSELKGSVESVAEETQTPSVQPEPEPEKEEVPSVEQTLEEARAVEEEEPVEEEEASLEEKADKAAVDETTDEPEDVEEEVLEAQEAIAEDLSTTEENSKEESNVVMVDAESLGFKKDVDILEEEEQLRDARGKGEKIPVEEVEEPPMRFQMPSVNITGYFDRVKSLMSGFRDASHGKFIAIAGVVIFVILAAFLYWALPHATVTIYEIPKTITETQSITIDPSATSIDAQTNTIPGREQDKSVSGSKTVEVTGTKNVGDPAKGTVTIYNKSPDAPLVLSKGTTLSTGSLQFTTDTDVAVASASANESFTGSTITYSTATVAVTASDVGAQSNVPANTQFTIKGVDNGIAMARNDVAFSGGNSRQVTVVTRDDEDAFVKSLSSDLTTQAQQEFSSSSGFQKVIEQTMKATVTDKSFDKELGQEAKEFTGKLTVTVTGTAYSDADVTALLTSLSLNQVPNGYSIDGTKTTVTVSNISVKKSGKITATAQMNAIALPMIDLSAIGKEITGKSIQAAGNYIRTLTGIASISVDVRLSPTRKTLPMNRHNITIKTAIEQ